MTIIRTITALTAAVSIAGCAASPDAIRAQYVSPTAYQGMSCDALNAEAVRINARMVQVTGQYEQKANEDAGLTAVALLVFWPAIFFIGNNDNAPELARIKGEAEAVHDAAVQKGCSA